MHTEVRLASGQEAEFLELVVVLANFFERQKVRLPKDPLARA